MHVKPRGGGARNSRKIGRPKLGKLLMKKVWISALDRPRQLPRGPQKGKNHST